MLLLIDSSKRVHEYKNLKIDVSGLLVMSKFEWNEQASIIFRICPNNEGCFRVFGYQKQSKEKRKQ